jgi:hypothetical protein
MLVQVFGTLFAGWTRKLIGVTTNDEKTNMGHCNGVQVRKVRRTEFNVVQIWCAPHQLDLVVHVAVDEVDGGAWVGQDLLHLVHVPPQAIEPNHRYGRDMPEEDEQVGRARVGVQVLHHLSVAHHRVP